MAASICKICNESHDYQSGFFTRHLLTSHNMSLEDYVILFEYDGIEPKCKCGLCEERPVFVRGKFKTHASGHKNFDLNKQMYIEKHGEPHCPTCNNIITNWHRGRPCKYCSKKCKPSTWNQEKIKNTVKEKYGVDNVFQIDSIKKICAATDHNCQKAIDTKINRYPDDPYGLKKINASVFKKYGVDHFSKTQIFKDIASKTIINTMRTMRMYKIYKYKETELYYQSSYELKFLNLCESLGILYKISNGNTYKYLDNTFGINLLTDFSINNIEIEIKSAYILKKQGGMKVLDAKRKAVEATGKRYMVLLDKDHSEFLDYIKDINISETIRLKLNKIQTNIKL